MVRKGVMLAKPRVLVDLPVFLDGTLIYRTSGSFCPIRVHWWVKDSPCVGESSRPVSFPLS